MLLAIGAWGLARAGPDPPWRELSLGGCPVRVYCGSDHVEVRVVCVHSVFQGRETTWPMAAALARQSGVEAYNAYMEGSYLACTGRLESLLRALRADSPVPIALIGHSMGADLVCDVARSHPELACACVAMGFPVQREDAPANLLCAIGAWDELHSLQEMQASGAPLVVLPWADHNLENFSPQLYFQAAGWIRSRAGLSGPQPALSPDPYLCRGLLLWGLLLAWVAVGVLPRWRLGLTALAVGLWALGSPGPTADALVRGLFLGTLVANGWSWSCSLAGRYAALAALAAAAAFYSNAAGNLWQSPGLALQLSGFMLQAPPLYAMCELAWPLTFPVMAVLLLAEAARPGLVWRSLWLVPRAFRRAVLGARLELGGKASPASLVLLALLLGAAAFSWQRTLAAGYGLAGPDVVRLLGKLICLVLVPMGVLVVGLRCGIEPE